MEFHGSSRIDIPTDRTLPDHVLRHAHRHKDRPALIDAAGGRRYTYWQLVEHVRNCATSLSQLGLGIGQRVCLLLPNCIEFPVAFLAILRLGAVCVPFNPAATKYELREMMRDSKPSFVITVREHLDSVQFASAADAQSQHHAIKPKMIIVGARPDGCVSFESLLHPSPREHGASPSSSSSSAAAAATTTTSVDTRRLMASIYYSSGTTGKPKGCVHTHFAYVGGSCQVIERIYGCDGLYGDQSIPEEVALVVLPLFHQFGTMVAIAQSLTVGHQVVLMSQFSPSQYVRLVNKYKVTVLHVVPAVLDKVLLSVSSDVLGRCLSTVRCIMTGGVALGDVTARKILQLIPGVQIVENYGMTELMPIAINAVGQFKFGCCGQLLANVSAKIVDTETGRDMTAANQDGEILIKTPVKFTSYWNNPDATRSSYDSQGWFKTGDYGHFDENGNLYIVGRVKELLKFKGFQVSPAELESVLRLHPDVVDAAVDSVRDDVDGDLPRALVVPRSPDIRLSDVISFVNERVSPYKRLRGGIELVGSLPRTVSGKIMRRFLRRTEQPTAAKL